MRTAILPRAALAVVLLIAGPAFAGSKILDFKAVKHDTVAELHDWGALTRSQPQAPVKLWNKDGSSVVEIKPRSNAKLSKNNFKLKTIAKIKGGIGGLAVGAAISALITGLDWVMKDGVVVKKTPGNPAPISQFGYTATNYCIGNHLSVAAATQCFLNYKIANTAPYDGKPYTITTRQQLGTNGFVTVTATCKWSGPTGQPHDCGNMGLSPYGSCSLPYQISSFECLAEADGVPLTDAEIDAGLDQRFTSMLTAKDIATAQTIFSELYNSDPANHYNLNPEFFVSANGLPTETINTLPKLRNYATVLPNGTTALRQDKEWKEYKVNYSPVSNEVTYNIVNHNDTYNELGEKVKEETETEPADEELPNVATSLAEANQPIKDYASQVGQTGSLLNAVAIPRFVTFGGTCSMPTIQFPVYGSYSFQPICNVVDGYVKPALGFLFAIYTVFSIFGIWRESTMQVRPA